MTMIAAGLELEGRFPIGRDPRKMDKTELQAVGHGKQPLLSNRLRACAAAWTAQRAARRAEFRSDRRVMMGKRSTADRDQARAVLAGSFGGTGQSGAIELWGAFNVTLSGEGTVRLERSFDDGASFFPVALDTAGSLASWTVDATGISLSGAEAEAGVLYRLNCTAFTSTITSRVSQ